MNTLFLLFVLIFCDRFCLNDGKHDFKKTTTIPDVLSKMRCTMCAETRDMTEEERLGFGIKTVDEYFKEIDK